MPTLQFATMPDLDDAATIEPQPDGSLAIDVPAGMRARVVVLREPEQVRDQAGRFIGVGIVRFPDAPPDTGSDYSAVDPDAFVWSNSEPVITRLGSFVLGRLSPECASENDR